MAKGKVEEEVEEWIWTGLTQRDGVKGRQAGLVSILLLAAQLYLLGSFGKGSLVMTIFVDGVPFMAHLLVLVPV